MPIALTYRRGAFRSPAALLLALSLITAAAAPGWAAAQEKPGASPAADPQTVLANINDLGLLRALVPLKLTSQQITPLLALMRKLDEEARSQVKQDGDVLRSLAADVERARREALSGTPVPTALEDRVATASKAAETRKKAARNLAVGRLLAVVKANLSADQQRLISAQTQKVLKGRLVPRQYQKEPSKAPPEVVQDLEVAYFIDNVLLNERAVTVLSQMRPPGADDVRPAADAPRPPAPPTAP